jgi:hypothetical protein
MYFQPHDTHLGQINVATARGVMESDLMADFVAMLGPVNALAERSDGFVWRLKDEDGAGATKIRVTDDPRTIVQISLWRDAASLEAFVWRTVHAKVYNRKAEWFPHDPAPNLALWWQPAGTVPTAQEAYDRLLHLRAHGPTAEAFGWKDLPGAQIWAERRCG